MSKNLLQIMFSELRNADDIYHPKLLLRILKKNYKDEYSWKGSKLFLIFYIKRLDLGRSSCQ